MAAKFNLTVEQGATFRQTVIWKDELGVKINLTGCTARMQVRQRVTSVTPLLDLTTENGGIVISTSVGGAYPDTIEIVITAAQSDAIAVCGGVYDLEVVMSNADVVRLLQGTVSFVPSVTREVV